MLHVELFFDFLIIESMDHIAFEFFNAEWSEELFLELLVPHYVLYKMNVFYFLDFLHMRRRDFKFGFSVEGGEVVRRELEICFCLLFHYVSPPRRSGEFSYSRGGVRNQRLISVISSKLGVVEEEIPPHVRSGRPHLLGFPA
jgi:hypothetical protein